MSEDAKLYSDVDFKLSYSHVMFWGDGAIFWQKPTPEKNQP